MNIFTIVLTIFYSLLIILLIGGIFFFFRLYSMVKKIEKEWNKSLFTKQQTTIKKPRQVKSKKLLKDVKQTTITTVGQSGMRIDLGYGHYIYDKDISKLPDDE